jgi:hypothetical protein
MVALVATQWSPSESALAQSRDRRSAAHGYQVTPLFTPVGLRTDQGYPLSNPDDIVRVRDGLIVAFQNGVGSTGGPAANGNTESSLVELTPAGHLVRQWNLTGKIDGLGVDPGARTLVATVDEDGASSLYTVDPAAPGSGVTHYCYDQKPLPHGGGTDSVAFYRGKLIISASAPNPAPADVPAVYAATLEPDVAPAKCPAGTPPATGTAVLAGGFSDTSPAPSANTGKPSVLALTDPDSSTVVPRSAPRFGGEFQLDSQGDDQQVYTPDPVGATNVDVLHLSQSVNDTAFVTSGNGALYATDATANAVDRISGPFEPGQAYVAVTPCNDNNAPSTCPAPDFPANYLGRLDLSSGSISSVSTGLQPGGLAFVPNGQGR